jgi:hypothetical protein
LALAAFFSEASSSGAPSGTISLRRLNMASWYDALIIRLQLATRLDTRSGRIASMIFGTSSILAWRTMKGL